MKLQRKIKPLPPKSYKVSLAGTLVEQINEYRHYYEDIYSEAVTPELLISEIVASFIPSDRDFKRWQRQQEDKRSDEQMA